ncbi:MAG TPA: MFS transporter [Pseudonocardiaceae bacterium]|jgi:MFS family permease|nr:MFS transporter [Pseudonocardiaceae bacterium]
MVEQAVTVDGRPRPFEWWMTSHLALALAFNCFLPVLLPSYVLSVGGTATDVGVALSMAGLFSLIGPSIGGFAVRHRAHRLVHTLGVLGMAIGLVALALSGGDSLSIVLAIAVMGIGAAAVAVAAPPFILGTDLPANIKERQLTWLQLNLDLGKIVGGLILGAMAAAKLPFSTQFRVGGLVIGLLGVLVWTTSRSVAARIHQPEVNPAIAGEPLRIVVPLKTLLLLSLFGVPVVSQLVGSMTMIEAQISTLLTVSGLVGIGLYFLTGRWMGRSSPGLVWATGHALRGAGGIVLGVLGLVRGQPYLVVLAAFLVLESIPAIVWIAQARTAAQFAPRATTTATGVASATRRSVPAGRLDQQGGRHAESFGVLRGSASPSVVRSRPAAPNSAPQRVYLRPSS